MKRRKFLHFSFFCILTILSFAVLISVALSPVFAQLAEEGCGNYARSVLFSSLTEISESEDFSCLTDISEKNGEITSVSLNSAKANKLLSDFANKTNSMLSDENYSAFSIPIGNLTGIPLLSGRGMKIPLKTVPLGAIDARIVSDFAEAGINQTKHSVCIKAKLKVRLMAPFYNHITETETTIPLSETVIVGKIPGFYAPGLR